MFHISIRGNIMSKTGSMRSSPALDALSAINKLRTEFSK